MIVPTGGNHAVRGKVIMKRNKKPEFGGYELAEEITGETRKRLYGLVASRAIPCVHLSRNIVRFSREGLTLWMNDMREKCKKSKGGRK